MNQNQPPQDQPGQPGAPSQGTGAGSSSPAPGPDAAQAPSPQADGYGPPHAQPPQGAPGGSAPGYSGGSGAPGGGPPAQGGYAGPPPGYGGPHGGYGAQGGYGGPQHGPGYPPQGPGAPASSGPGLFDLTFRTPLAPRIAKIGMIALWVLGGLIALAGLVGFISMALNASYYGYTASMVFSAVVEMFVAFATALVIVVLGRMGIELALAVVTGRDKATKDEGATQ